MKFSLRTILFHSTILTILSTSLIYSQVREGVATGVLFSSATTTNSWKGLPDGTSFKNTEGTANKWSIPISYSHYGDGTYYDWTTDIAGWILLGLIGDGHDTPTTPAFSENDKYRFTDINASSIRFAMDLFEVGVLIGGQGGFGFLGTGLKEKKDKENVFEASGYASYGANAGINLSFGDQFLQGLFLYDWVIMGDDAKGNSWTAEVEYFPFRASSDFNLVRFKAFGKSSTISYPKKIAGQDYDYSDFQIGVGIMLHGPIF